MQFYFYYHDQNLMETQPVLFSCKRNQFCFLAMNLNVYIESPAYIRNLQALHQKATNTANAFEMQFYFLYLDQNVVIQIVNLTCFLFFCY